MLTVYPGVSKITWETYMKAMVLPESHESPCERDTLDLLLVNRKQ